MLAARVLRESVLLVRGAGRRPPPGWRLRPRAAPAPPLRAIKQSSAASSFSSNTREDGSQPPASSSPPASSPETAEEARTRRRKRARELAQRGSDGLREMWRRYGYVAIGTYFSIYAATLGGAFSVFHFGIVDPEVIVGDPRVAIEKLITFVQNQEEYVPQIILAEPYLHMLRDTPAATNIALAWIATKITEPARALITMGITPRLARLAGRVPATLEEESEEGKDGGSGDGATKGDKDRS
uniref:DUF1279 domain-containing protein n=1 Tax=Phaeomonas parva TaxID=124430 RepID=A0A7S1XYK1_9STRA|mmetsp:Transcript_44655/g.140028  ORF Transcript_44655/g.140028 Transcript_44655/m.140028 type:complete len:241 (+) Transcript_44655:486-1208(+)|eukprot:CAMPEP_0118866738 /NCGR_PEP_ID=MMETSP1163-20130328/10542_1 /TAXON_ID=124430 /ORGANISM="Phaeomonas parva, Strain CCMP2877" /LENGTH=240 /DNA_ID=CAMNT_0006801081 /DNA_START=173 /DNA_END=895 /DNA_ORIENTATION=-